eukprot:scaffold8634_cov115-Isochrysis_galbana.AAC.9
MSASLSTSLRADYGGALDICVAIFGREGGDGGLGELGESERIGGFSVQSRPPVRFAPPRPNALGRRGILRFYKFFFFHSSLVALLAWARRRRAQSLLIGGGSLVAHLYGCPPEPSFEQRMRREHKF